MVTLDEMEQQLGSFKTSERHRELFQMLKRLYAEVQAPQIVNDD